MKRNVKFDEDDLGLYMDIQLRSDRQWKRVKPEQARKALASSGRRSGPAEMEAGELASMLADTGESE